MSVKSKADTRLSKLLSNFGGDAGSQPAAQAISMPPIEPDPPPQLAPTQSIAPVVPQKVESAPVTTKPSPKPLVRNIGLTEADMMEIERLETLLLANKREIGGRVSLADVVRVALYSAYPTKDQALQVLLATRQHDGRIRKK